MLNACLCSGNEVFYTLASTIVTAVPTLFSCCMGCAVANVTRVWQPAVLGMQKNTQNSQLQQQRLSGSIILMAAAMTWCHLDPGMQTKTECQ
jgi:hypothetical protein